MIRFLRPAEVAKRVGLHPVHIRRLERHPDPVRRFPKAVVIGANSVGYIESEVKAWLKARIEERDQGKALRPSGPRRRAGGKVEA